MLAEIAIAAARRTERTLGAGAALGLVRAAAETADASGRRTLLLAALGLAVRANDPGAFTALAIEWARSGGDAGEKRGLSLVARLADHGHLALAQKLARAEIERHRSPEALYALGAILEREGHAADLVRTFSEAGPLGARAALGHAGPGRADEAESELARATTPRDLLRLAPTALTSARLYARVRTLDRLLELGTVAALRIGLAHADLRGAALSPIEKDRLLAIAKRANAGQIVDALEGRATSNVDEALARDALVGHAPAGESGDRAVTLALRVLAVVSRGESAALLLSALVAHPPSPVGWTALLAALASPRSRDAAVALADRWIPSGLAPPRGFSQLAALLERAGAEAVAQRAWSEAIRACEPGARERVAASLETRAYAAYAAGDRVLAKALIERSLAIVPD